MTTSSPRQHLLPWDQPLLPQAVRWLAADWRGDQPLDLSGQLVLVPTRQSGRRLREALAEFAAQRGQAVFPPQVLSPEGFVAIAARDPGVASRPAALLAWTEVLRQVDLADFAEVFPVEPPARNFAWAVRLARQLAKLQQTLAENGLRIATAARRASDFPEAARWAQLAPLEQRYDAALARRGLRDVHAATLAAAESPTSLPGIRRVVLLGTPDPLPLAVNLLAAYAATLPVDVVVFGPRDASRADLFDAWGRPQTEAWLRRPLALADFAQHVRLCADPAEQAEVVARAAQAYRAPEGMLALGVADPEIIPPLQALLTHAAIASYDPEGSVRRQEGFHALLRLLADFAREPAFDAVAALLRSPDVLAWLADAHGPAFSPSGLLAACDELHAHHLPTTLADAREHAHGRAAATREPSARPRSAHAWPLLASALDALTALHAQLAAQPFPANIRGALATIFGPRQFHLEREADARVVDAAAAWMDALEESAAATAAFPGATADEALELALADFGDRRRFDDKPAGALELQGWLELLWEDAPHLVIAGLNDGRVPDTIAGDPFLPDALRAHLGLKTNQARLARDVYLVHALAACRAGAGRIDFVYGKASAAGDPLRPSRLLLLCDDAALPARVQFLFRPADSPNASIAWERAWQLVPPPARPLTALRVTAFRDYLRCPFRFYLKHALRMSAVAPLKAELDALDFGNLCHAALERMGRDPAMIECTDAATLREFLLQQLEHAARARLGAELTVPLLIQLESARQRLAKAADVQARERAAGWRIERVESPFAFELQGLTVRGTIDRIERHTDTGAVRVLDYKTSDKSAQPRDAHSRQLRRNDELERIPEFARFARVGEARVWKDLQLPLYLHALAAEFGAAITCGYFNLPKASGETAVAIWSDYDGEWQAAAERCARGVVESVNAARFWPPAELDPEQDEFAELFHHGAEASIAHPTHASAAATASRAQPDEP